MNLYLNDIGIVNALGSGKTRVLDALLADDNSGMLDTGPLLTGRHSLAGVVRDSLESVPERLANFDCRNNRLLATALRQIEPGITDAVETYGRHRIGVVIGTSTSGIAASEAAHEALRRTGAMPADFDYRQQEIGTAAEFVARYLSMTGPRFTISTACSSSAKAFASAARLILAGRCDAAIVGGSDSLCRLTLNGFDALESLAPGACNPFSVNRCGINIGEGACVAVLSKAPGAIRLLGFGESSDGYHMAAPDPSGRGAEQAIRAALQSAGLRPENVDYVNLHGTATRKNDEMEAAVVARVFGRRVPCSSTKPRFGHTLGAAGAQEIGICWIVLSDDNRKQQLPRHTWDGERDPAIPEIDLIEGEARWTNGIVVSNTFGFGGSNVSVVIGRSP